MSATNHDKDAALGYLLLRVSAHDRIVGRPSRAKVLDEFVIYAQSHPGVAIMRKDEIARFAPQSPSPSAKAFSSGRSSTWSGSVSSGNL